MRDKTRCNSLVDKDHPITLGKEIESASTYSVFEGSLTSPMVDHLTDLLPVEVQTAKFQLMLPKKQRHQTLRPICIHLGGTGDHVSIHESIFLQVLIESLIRVSGSVEF